jgi:hypothetical protein
MRRSGVVPSVLLVVSLSACNLEVFSTPKRPAKDGYRAVFVASDGSRAPLAARRGKRRIENPRFVRILDLTQQKTILLRPDRKIYFESPAPPGDEIAPEYELEPNFDPKVRFPGREVLELGDDVQAGHVCALYQLWTSKTECLVYWVAKDLDRLVVRIQGQRLEAGELKDAKMEELVGVRPGADESLFRVPAGYRRAMSREEIVK